MNKKVSDEKKSEVAEKALHCLLAHCANCVGDDEPAECRGCHIRKAQELLKQIVPAGGNR